MDKFINEYEKYRITFNIEFKAKYGIKTDFKIIPDLVLYKKIEKRGYFVRLNGSELECPEMVWFGEMVKY